MATVSMRLHEYSEGNRVITGSQSNSTARARLWFHLLPGECLVHGERGGDLPEGRAAGWQGEWEWDKGRDPKVK